MRTKKARPKSCKRKKNKDEKHHGEKKKQKATQGENWPWGSATGGDLTTNRGKKKRTEERRRGGSGVRVGEKKSKKGT